MTKTIFASMAALSLLVGSAAAQDDPGTGYAGPAGTWYGQVALGISVPTEDGATFGGIGGELDYDVGAAFGGLIGYQRGNLGIEGEVIGRSNDFDGNISDESLTVTTVLVNGVLSGPDTSRWVPYVGGGVGYAFSNIEDTDGSFAFQGKAGIRYGLDAGVSSVGVEASYLNTGGFEDEDFGVDVDYSAFSVMATYKMNFGY